MFQVDTHAARAVLDFLDSHPQLPRIAAIDHHSYSHPRDRRSYHDLQIDDESIAAALAWHDVLTEVRVVLNDYPDSGSVHIGLYGLLPTGPGVHVYAAVRGDERIALLLNTDLRFISHGCEVDVSVLRRLTDARVAEAVA
ncbi:hypothetical protein GCM10012275_02490 [Longimycelium tulufanense]|uniref:Uncharacterized protein n=1 Tax=Longimycelium tulufanense TaxID=907463 RepID=A0A8J3CBF5_9PSEU|nr:hypothetical protein [Longimycelium tulufanense]GGM34704.1 hypothetical protein GCM10012275_02490 [Longimycelium tulufanense]